MIQEIKIRIVNNENIPLLSGVDILKIQEIVSALIVSGGLTGVKSGQTIIHYDSEGTFQSIELKYHPWIRRRQKP